MFGIGGFELFLILLFGFLIFGPDRLPGIARTIGNAISRFRNASDGMNKTLQKAQNEVFDKNSAEPFKNPLDVIENIAGTATAATGSAQAAEGAGTTKTIAAHPATSSSESAGSREDIEHTESFAERKARYDRERAERKAAEKKAAEQATAEASAAAHADPADEVANETLSEQTGHDAATPKNVNTEKTDRAVTDSANVAVATAKTDTVADLEKKEA